MTSISYARPRLPPTVIQHAVWLYLRFSLSYRDIVFLNVGLGQFRPIEAWDETAFDRSFGINLKSPFFLIQALLRIFANPASIVLYGSINADVGMPNSSIYAASEAGVVALSKTLSGELIGPGIRANVISPGSIETSFYTKLGLRPADAAAMKSGILSQIPAGRFGKAVEIADLAVYLASDESRYTVGSEIVIDGEISIL